MAYMLSPSTLPVPLCPTSGCRDLAGADLDPVDRLLELVDREPVDLRLLDECGGGGLADRVVPDLVGLLLRREGELEDQALAP
jgi:hypothetical protein